MRKRSSIKLAALVAALALVPIIVLTTRGPATDWRSLFPALFGTPRGERLRGCYTLVDEAGSILLRTGIPVRRGDIFIDPADRWHRVIRVRADRAETVVVASEVSAAPASAATGASSSLSGSSEFGPGAVPLGTARQVIVIYHTHSDESYIPSDGATSIYAAGGVYDVGDAMSAQLSAAGFTVVHDRTPHDPHDAGAYPRSRRTVLRNLQYGPTLVLDVHRDSAPASEYLTTIGGVTTARVMIVIGGGNPLHRGNLGVANRLKTAADGLYPGLTRGIFLASGNYNQDLAPAGVLVEVGSENVPKPLAERAGSLWADVVTAYLGSPGPGPAPGAPAPAPAP